MKQLLLTLMATLFVAGQFSYMNASGTSLNEAMNKVFSKKAFAIRCSPLYIPAGDQLIPALTGWGNHQWKITTASDSAQFYYNQGINMYYAFHIIEARASFEKATRFDTGCAMAWWGKALAFGPNINDFEYNRPAEAYPSAIKAKQVYTDNTPLEKALIDAMLARYLPDTSISQQELNNAYVRAMKKVYHAFSTNAEVTSLYADALMVIHPWDLYDNVYKPKPWTTELVQVIEHAIALDPSHPGANHYYIHAVEASKQPGKALKSAKLLETLMPDVSHVTHMPSHIYIRTGNYSKGIGVNDNAIIGFGKYQSMFSPVTENAFLYVLHNLHMKVNCAQMAGNYTEALAAAQQLQKEIPTEYLSYPGPLGSYIQSMNEARLITMVRFGKWDELLQTPVHDTLVFARVINHFGRGMALAKTNHLAEAVNELAALKKKLDNQVLKQPFTPFSAAYDAGLVAQYILAGTIAVQKKSNNEAIALFKKAVEAEDKIIYTEPRDWLLPARQYLGNALLQAKRYAEAEKAFRQDLVINPNNGWSLTGLSLAYAAQNKKAALAVTQKALKDAWMIKNIKIEQPVF